MNPPTAVDYSKWAVQTAFDGAIALREVGSTEGKLTRNGEEFTPAQLVINSTNYYLLPEGYYDEFTDKKLVSKTDVTDGSAVATLISNLNGLTAESDDFAGKLIEYEKNYNALSETLRYYVDQTVNTDHTVAALMENLKGSHQVEVTLQHGYDESQNITKTVTFYGAGSIEFGIPTRDNYKFLGWYLGDNPITNADGICSRWTYSIAPVILTARWSSSIEGEGTEDNPYILTSTANLVVLSRISNGVATEDELALFGENATEASVLAAHYKLSDDWASQTLSTEDGFYGITGFQGTFDGNDKTITLNVDTSTLAESEGKYAGQVNISQDQENPVYLEITGGLFNRVAEGTIQNLIIEGSVKLLFRSSFAGVFAGQADNSAFINCTNSASLTVGSVDDVSSTTWSGGIVGYAYGNGTTKFQQCINNGNIYAGSFAVSQGNSAAAGICAYSGAENLIFENCVNTGELSATRQHQYEDTRYTRVAGILSATASGTKLVKLSDCKNYGGLSAVAGNNNAGAGICLADPQTKLELSNCENYGTVTALGLEGRACLLSGCSDFTVAEIESVTYNNCYHVMSGSAICLGTELGQP